MGAEFKIPDNGVKQLPAVPRWRWRPSVRNIIHGLVDQIFPPDHSSDSNVSSRSEPRNKSDVRSREENADMAAANNTDAIPDGFYTLDTLPPLSRGAQKIIDALNRSAPFVKVDENADQKYSGLKLVDRSGGGIKLLD